MNTGTLRRGTLPSVVSIVLVTARVAGVGASETQVPSQARAVHCSGILVTNSGL